MATKAKPKSKTTKKITGRASATAKSIRLKTKPAKSSSSNLPRNGSKPSSKTSARHPAKTARVGSRRTPVATGPPSASRSSAPERARSKHFASAIQAYEAGNNRDAAAIHNKLMPITEALFFESNPGPLKAVLSILGVCSDTLRLPLAPVAASTFERIRSILQRSEQNLNEIP